MQTQFLSGGFNLNYFLFNQNASDVKAEAKNNFAFQLDQNYPNPFNPSTEITYTIPSKSFVTLKIFNILGKETTTLINEEKAQGFYFVNFNAENLPAGIYIYKIIAGKYTATKKMILLK